MFWISAEVNCKCAQYWTCKWKIITTLNVTELQFEIAPREFVRLAFMSLNTEAFRGFSLSLQLNTWTVYYHSTTQAKASKQDWVGVYRSQIQGSIICHQACKAKRSEASSHSSSWVNKEEEEGEQQAAIKALCSSNSTGSHSIFAQPSSGTGGKAATNATIVLPRAPTSLQSPLYTLVHVVAVRADGVAVLLTLTTDEPRCVEHLHRQAKCLISHLQPAIVLGFVDFRFELVVE